MLSYQHFAGQLGAVIGVRIDQQQSVPSFLPSHR